MFAVVNLIGATLSVIAGHQKVVHALTGGLLRKPRSRAWPISVILQLSLHLGGASLNALLISTTPGYSEVSVGQLGLLFLARPRLTWVPLNALALTEWYRSASKATVVTGTILSSLVLLPWVVPHISLPFMATTTPSALLCHQISDKYQEKRANQTPIEFGGEESFIAIGLIVVNTFYNWLGNWPFWVGFVRLSGDLYVSVLVLGPRLLECF
jgi:hypothetical protein